MEPHPPLYLPSDGDDNVFDPAYTGVIDGVSLDLRLRNRVFGNVLSLGDRDPVLLRPEDKRHILSHYDAAIQYVDRYVGKIMDELAKAGLVDKSIVIITADHGLDILEHNTLFNYSSQAPYEEIAHVPLIIVHPGKNERGVKVHRPVCLIDVLPTVLDCLNIPPKADAEGVSLAPLLEGRGESGTGDRIIYSTGSGERLRNIDSCSWAVQEKEWKLIIRPQYHYPLVELYNIRKDPAETTDRARQETGIADRLFMRYLHSLKKMNGDRQDDAED
jgi:arylsulfatase A-like enzyme